MTADYQPDIEVQIRAAFERVAAAHGAIRLAGGALPDHLLQARSFGQQLGNLARWARNESPVASQVDELGRIPSSWLAVGCVAVGCVAVSCVAVS